MLVKSLFHLSRAQRLVVILRYFNGSAAIQEIASVLKCSEGLVKNILFRSVCSA